MKVIKKIGLGVLFMSAVITTSCAINSNAISEKGRFVHTEKPYETSLGDLWPIAKSYINNKRTAAKPHQKTPLKQLTRVQLEQGTEDTLYRLGHSTILMRLSGQFVLTDPVFSDRASPVQWAGPKRFHPSPITIEALPDIKVVVISHDHYDHLDKDAIKKLVKKVEYFVAPTNVGKYLIDWGVDKSKVIELSWWESKQIDGLTFVATPAQHFSGRGLFDRNSTLWASWVIKSTNSNLFFSGDGGYFSGFKEIGERFGPFDITLVENGAYNTLWSDIHMMPEQSIQAHLDLQGKAMLPIHNSTFDLSTHDWFEPLERTHDLARQKNISLITPIFGEAVLIKNPTNHYTWWKEMQTDPESLLAYD